MAKSQYPIVPANKWGENRLHEQEIIVEGKHYRVMDLVQQSSHLPVMDLPVVAMRMDYRLKDAECDLIKFVGHMKAVLEADMSYPIILDYDGYLLDGRHRLTKAIFSGDVSIKAVRFTEPAIPSYVESE